MSLADTWSNEPNLRGTPLAPFENSGLNVCFCKIHLRNTNNVDTHKEATTENTGHSSAIKPSSPFLETNVLFSSYRVFVKLGTDQERAAVSCPSPALTELSHSLSKTLNLRDWQCEGTHRYTLVFMQMYSQAR